MRLACTINATHPEENPFALSQLLKNHGVENSCEEVTLPDQATFYRIWVHEEDKLALAMKLYRDYQKNPQDFPFVETIEEGEGTSSEEPADISPRSRSLSRAPYGKVTIFFLLSCILLFLWGFLGQKIESVPRIPSVYESPPFPAIYKALIFDYPNYFVLRDKLLTLYTAADIKEKKPPSQEAKAVLQQMKKTAVWLGFYPLLVNYIKDKTPLTYEGPFFEKIEQGQLWRLFTPALLHGSFLHIFFNLLWFIVLGNQIEYRIGPFRYLILIFATAIVANILQYFMSGPFFLGLSAVVIGQAGFIWARQQKAAWEGYLLQRATLFFLGAFVFGMFILQLIFFILQISGNFQVMIPIANTAHIAGGVVGYLLGRLSFFKLKK